MKTIGTEEHFVTQDVIDAWERLGRAGEGSWHGAMRPLRSQLLEVGESRIAEMDEGGLDVQVISLTGPGVGILPVEEGKRLQVETNDQLADMVAAHPDRFQGYATLATQAPAAAAEELERVVTKLGLHGALVFGRTGERNLDHPDNEPLFEAAAALRAPLYIHPQRPQQQVRDAIYSGYSDDVNHWFASSGIGWHYESGVQFLRLALSGVFDRHPDLQVILGHWGEVILFYLDRADNLARRAKLPRTFSEYIRDQAYITAGGVYSQRYLRWSVEVAGADRVMFASDFPYQSCPEGGCQQFLEGAGLDPADVERVAYGNWDRLVAGIRR